MNWILQNNWWTNFLIKVWNIIALTNKLQKHIAQCFLNKKIVNIEEKVKFKSYLTSSIKGKKISWKVSTNSKLKSWKMSLKIQDKK